MKEISIEEFDELSMDEKKQYLIEMVSLVPDEHVKELYDEVTKTLEDFESGKIE